MQPAMLLATLMVSESAEKTLAAEPGPPQPALDIVLSAAFVAAAAMMLCAALKCTLTRAVFLGWLSAAKMTVGAALVHMVASLVLRPASVP